MSDAVIEVAVGIVYDTQGRIYITRRAANVHQGGLWEFPGGKREYGESPQQALFRELKEELGIEVHRAQALIQVRHTYPDCDVLLDVWKVWDYDGEPQGMEGQSGCWVEPSSLADYTFPPADIPIVNALLLPEIYVITPDHLDWVAQLPELLQRGVRLIQLRLPGVSKTQLQTLLSRIQPLVKQYRCNLLLNRQVEWVASLSLQGVHLSAAQLKTYTNRPLSTDYWVAASCHTVEDLQLAQALSVDFIVLSPVKATLSHPQAEPLGWSQFALMCAQVSIPVYALGGLCRDDIAQARQSGGQGVAGIRAFL